MSKIRISPDVIFQPVLLGESLLLNVKTLTYFAFDPLGTKFWAAIQSSSDADQAIQKMVMASDRPASELQPKLHAILTGLQRSGLISITQ